MPATVARDAVPVRPPTKPPVAVMIPEVLILKVEHTESENISLEASGNPTFICGLLARATNLAANYADKNIDYYYSGEEVDDDDWIEPEY